VSNPRSTVSEKSWEEVTVAPHRFGEIEFWLGKRDWGMSMATLVDISFPRHVRDKVIAAGDSEPHHILPEKRMGQRISSFRRRSGALNTIAPPFLLFGCGSSPAPGENRGQLRQLGELP
jgi:hypothetical protein